MKNNRLHLILRFFALLAVVVLILPMIVKSVFIFEEHHHDICIDDQTDSHLHEKDFHCEFYKFNFNQNLFFESTINSSKIASEFYPEITAYYTFLKSQKQSTSYLRGPPSLM
ncbi:MAG: ABC-type spermidine/putrescine transport system permease subunit II [Glaciecola sp.]|jgi:ABC-type spermidine/putrescine transport system permease subunit II